MTEYFIDPAGGDDANAGTDAGAPFATITRAFAALGAGDMLNLHAGSTYGPRLSFSAKLPAGIVVQPYAGDHIVVDGQLREPDLAGVPNGAWERVAGGHRDEWRTRATIALYIPGPRNVARVRYGAFAASRLRLITYSRLEDLRAANESFRAVPLSDPRPAGGPLVGDPAHKQPWTYLGPGLIWVFEHPEDPSDRRGRVHVRLSPTHLRAPGTRDHDGPTDPNQVGLALSAEGRVAVSVGASGTELRRLVIANGGTTTLQVTGAARDVTFDHCAVYGGRFGVKVSGQAARISFRHCTFDGALAPWTVRSDVKSEYDFVSTNGDEVHNSLGAETHDMLVLTPAADGVEFDHCTFRRAHDGLQLGGNDVSVHHCLFEDVHDEVVQFNRTSNARVFQNLMRQVCHPFSFALERSGGPVFIYRNVIDQRFPTRGYRALPPDAPAPHVFRYGASYKTGFPMPATYVYQNTFVGADRDDKGTALSVLFAPLRSVYRSCPGAPQQHRRRSRRRRAAHVGRHPLAGPTIGREPVVLPQRVNAPSRCATSPVVGSNACPPWNACANWAGSRAARSRSRSCATSTTRSSTHGRYLGEDQPNNDWRPAPGSPVIGGGVVLPAELPDPDRPVSGRRPDIGAMTADAPPLRVGVDDAVVLPEQQRPIARAGPDQLIVDTDDDGFATVTLDAATSTSPTGLLTGHIWSIGGVTIASQPVSTVLLAEGEHLVRLAVRNNAGRTDTDSIRVAIRPVRPHGADLVLAGGFEEPGPWRLHAATIVEGGAHSGGRALRLAPSEAASAASASSSTRARATDCRRGFGG